MSNAPYKFDDSFYKLANNLAEVLKRNFDGTDQKQQVELLMKLENQFKKSILKFSQSREIYKKFILLVVVQNQNILSARPYFREKAVSFSKKITPALQKADVKALQEFNINFKFINFIRDNWLGAFPERSSVLLNKIEKARRVLIENNLPLAINEAKRFHRKVPENHVSLMDMVAAAAEGLGSGIDKWVGPYSKVFRSVCIGRMKGNMVDMYSETTLHFFPTDKRILYKANTIKFREGADTLLELVDAINKSFAQDELDGKKGSKERVTEGQLYNLMHAASTFSIDSKSDESEGEEGQTILDLTPDNDSIEDRIINSETFTKAVMVARGMDSITRKILIMKGLDI